MNAIVQEFFNLRRPPFDKDLPDEGLWLDGERKDAIERLTDAVTARQHAVVLGAPGVGKNCVVRGLRASLSLVLVGLPELGDRLKIGVHRSLLTRIAHKIVVAPATAELTAQYVSKRLADAGAKNDLFARDALTVLHELTGGVLRSVDVLADATLRVAAHKKVKLVDR